MVYTLTTMTEGIKGLRLTPVLAERRTTPDHIADALRDAILSGTLTDGQELNQVALAEHFGVSRVPVREALRQLQAEGLISAKAHHRAVVTSLTMEHIVEIFEIRILLESYLLEKAIPNSDAAHLAALEDLLDRLDAIEDHHEWVATNREFHRLLYQPSERTITIALVEQLGARIERYLTAWSAGEGVQRMAEAGAEHRAILAAVGEKDVRRARTELELHIMRTRQGVEHLPPSAEASQKQATTKG